MTLHSAMQRMLKTAQKVPSLFWLAGLTTLPISMIILSLWLLSWRDLDECEAAKTSTTVSDSTRLYCAQTIADRQNAESLMTAIHLADAIAADHPLRGQGDHLIEQWASRVLEIGETTFQAGNLSEAIALVEQIPYGTPVLDKVQPKVQEWQAIWTEAEDIYDNAQTALTDDKPTVALAEARKLLRVRNQYWSTTQFQEIATQIQAMRENRNQTTQARKSEKPKEAVLTATNSSDLINRWEKEQELEASSYLEKARQLAAGGTIGSLRQAISNAELVFVGTPQYPKAQRLINDWTRQIETIEDTPYLDRAVRLASKGDMSSLQAAISEANNIYFGRALYHNAQHKIDQWTAQVRQLHDQQYSSPNTSSGTYQPANLPTNQFSETD